jgi:energy-coupling factor transporter ATP-binding protein EcfA2
MDHKPNELSGSQQRRVAIGRTLANEAPLLMADEPTGNLDSASTIEIMTLFKGLNQGKGVTLIVVTHATDVAAWSSRVVTFRDGLIIRVAAGIASVAIGAVAQAVVMKQSDVVAILANVPEVVGAAPFSQTTLRSWRAETTGPRRSAARRRNGRPWATWSWPRALSSPPTMSRA